MSTSETKTQPSTPLFVKEHPDLSLRKMISIMALNFIVLNFVQLDDNIGTINAISNNDYSIRSFLRPFQNFSISFPFITGFYIINALNVILMFSVSMGKYNLQKFLFFTLYLIDIPLGYLLFVTTKLVNAVKVSLVFNFIYLIVYEFWKLSVAPRFYYGKLNDLESKQTDMLWIHSQFLYTLIQIALIHLLPIKNCEVLNICSSMMQGYENRKVQKLSRYMFMNLGEKKDGEEAEYLKKKIRRSMVGTFELSTEDQKIIYCLNRIIPLVDQEYVAKESHKKQLQLLQEKNAVRRGSSKIESQETQNFLSA